MANQTEALAWILAHSSQLDLAIHRLDWIDDLLPGWTDICCTLHSGRGQIESWGAAPTDDLALVKAFSEAAERVVFFSSGAETTNGFASHLTLEEAALSAKYELLERDLFLCHFLTRTPFPPINTDKLGYKWLAGALSWARRRQVELRWYQLGSKGAVCAISGFRSSVPFGYILGSSMKVELEAAMLNSLIEAARRQVLNRASQGNFSLEHFMKLSHPNFGDHGCLGMNIDFARQISFLFERKSTSATLATPTTLALDLIQTAQLNWPGAKFSPCPFVFVRAYSNEVQQMFLGAPRENVLNFQRLSTFANCPLSLADINPLPHPYD